MSVTLSAAAARRIFLRAQGLANRRPRTLVTQPRMAEYLRRQGIVQLDSVNVLARAHYLPVFSRLGPYDMGEWDHYLWRSGETFEHWGHEASVMPRDLLPALAVRMQRPSSWKAATLTMLEGERPGLLAQVSEALRERGPMTASDLEHLAPRTTKAGSWWDHSHVKTALEYLFITGAAAVADRPRFQRVYGDPAATWGHQAADVALPEDEAQQVLFDRALTATHIGTVADVADHFRLKPSRCADLARHAVDRGRAQWVQVDGWSEPALLHVDAQDPGRATGRALLSPFDPVCWFRPRLERMFGMRYRIEIYTPAARREYGYYCLPFLLGDQMVARVDLKAERKAGALRVQAAWREEPGGAFGRRRSDADVAQALAEELELMAQWLGLGEIEVEPRGTLAPALAHALAS